MFGNHEVCVACDDFVGGDRLVVVLRCLHPRFQGDGDGDGGTSYSLASSLSEYRRCPSRLSQPSATTALFHRLDGKVLDSRCESLRIRSTQPESCVCAANRLAISPPCRMIGACSTRGTPRPYRKSGMCWRSQYREMENCPVADDRRESSRKSPAGRPSDRQRRIRDPLFTVSGNCPPSHPPEGRTVLCWRRTAKAESV
jgi:hypothetical protein